VLCGIRADAQSDEHCCKSADGHGAVWFGEVDDLWRLGAPAGVGGPWKDTVVKADQPSAPYLMAGYRTKSVTLSHNAAQPVTFTVEVDFVANDNWIPYAQFSVKPGESLNHCFPDGYSAHWVRVKVDRDCVATAVFTYLP
jgi:hypothetical protein